MTSAASALGARKPGSTWHNVAACCALIFLLSLTWLAVKVALAGASVGLVSAGRVAFTVIALWLLARYGPGSPTPARRGELTGQDGLSQQPASSAGFASPVSRRDALWLSIAGVSGYTVLSTLAVWLGGTLLPSLIVATGPLWVLLLQRLLGRAEMSLSAIAGTILAVSAAGGFILAGAAGTGHVSPVSVGCAVGAVLLMSLYMVRFSALTTSYHGPMAPVITPIYAWGLVPLAAWAVWDLIRGERLSLGAFAILAGLGLLVYLPVYLLQHRLLAGVGAHTVSLLGLIVTPAVGVETALARLGPWPSLPQWIFIALTLAGMALVIGRPARPAPGQ